MTLALPPLCLVLQEPKGDSHGTEQAKRAWRGRTEMSESRSLHSKDTEGCRDDVD